jgi:hypothetical protein
MIVHMTQIHVHQSHFDLSSNFEQGIQKVLIRKLVKNGDFLVQHPLMNPFLSNKKPVI